jgi:hypothetical protein
VSTSLEILKALVRVLAWRGSFGLLALTCASCAAAPPENSPASATLWQQIQAEVGDAACEGPQQCHSIGLGAKACGGPEGFLAWSSLAGDSKKLQSLVAQYAAARKGEQERSGMVSDCALVSDPGVACMAGRCTLLPRPGRSGLSAN